MPTVLITGATSYLGSHLATKLAGLDWELRCLVRPEDPAEKLAGLPFARLEGTPSDEAIVTEGLRGCDTVINIDCEPFGSASRERMWKANVLHAQQLAKRTRASGDCRFLHVSTFLTIGGSRRPQILDETAPYNLGRYQLPYADSRRDGEDAVLAEVAHGLDAVVVNPGCITGTDSPARATVTAHPPSHYPSGGVNLVDIGYVVDGCIRAIEYGRTGQRYILGGDNLTGCEAVHELQATTPRAAPLPVLSGFAAKLLAPARRLVEIVRPSAALHSSEMLRMYPLFFWFSSQKAIDELGYCHGDEPASNAGASPAAATSADTATELARLPGT